MSLGAISWSRLAQVVYLRVETVHLSSLKAALDTFSHLRPQITSLIIILSVADILNLPGGATLCIFDGARDVCKISRTKHEKWLQLLATNHRSREFRNRGCCCFMHEYDTAFVIQREKQTVLLIFRDAIHICLYYKTKHKSINKHFPKQREQILRLNKQ